jgi:hypothetical protein
MTAAYRQYTEEMHRRFGYLATWLPNSKVELGDVGLLRRDRFERITDLERLGIPFTSGGIGNPADYEYMSADSVEAAFKSDTKLSVPQVGVTPEAVLAITFGRANAVVFVAHGCTTETIEDLDEVGRRILSMDRNGKWERDHVVVTELVRAASATILISSGAQASAELAVRARGGISTLSLGEAAADVRLISSSGIGTKIIAAMEVSPLFRASGVQTRLLRGKRFETKGRKALARGVADFVEVDYGDEEGG